MKAKTLLSLSVMAAVAAIATSALGDVARYQGSFQTYTLSDGSTAAVYVDSCDGSFFGTQTSGAVQTTVTGNIVGSAIKFNSQVGTYDPLTGNFLLGTTLGTMSSSTQTTFANHGDFVSSVPPSQRALAAHSCIGMPVNAYKAGNHGHQSTAYMAPHGNSANAPGHASSSTTSTTSTAPGNSDHANQAASDSDGNGNGNGGSGNGNGNGNSKH
jgi:hypothetical protein